MTKRVTRRLNRARQRGQGQIWWRERNREKERQNEEMATLQSKNRMLIRQNEELRMEINSWQLRWGSYQPMPLMDPYENMWQYF